MKQKQSDLNTEMSSVEQVQEMAPKNFADISQEHQLSFEPTGENMTIHYNPPELNNSLEQSKELRASYFSSISDYQNPRNNVR